MPKRLQFLKKTYKFTMNCSANKKESVGNTEIRTTIRETANTYQISLPSPTLLMHLCARPTESRPLSYWRRLCPTLDRDNNPSTFSLLSYAFLYYSISGWHDVYGYTFQQQTHEPLWTELWWCGACAANAEKAISKSEFRRKCTKITPRRKIIVIVRFKEKW